MNELDPIAAAEARLGAVLDRLGPLAIAVSGGVDSMTLAFFAHRHGAEMVHALSPAVPMAATERVRRHAVRLGWALTETRAGEFSDPDYLANPVNRCFFCKANLYDRIASLTTRTIASGANLDDLGDYRPGLLAAAERRVVHPLVEARIDKRMVRALAARAGLGDLAELPAQPCLSSRVETGIAIDADDLGFIDRVESAVRGLTGASVETRCRITHQGVVLELDPDDPTHADAAAAAMALTAETGRRWAGTRPYKRGAAFLHKT
ncbi:uncharacterized protein SAMN02983003_0084 [Devosia enhydra]|uniref:Asparagine synthetase domain-containing protein n=1 Tax=Devosia enhydra TaxID=665118 RepID=A0A1K2HSW9_9HYPH|nr:adenine nucleotide alpha hydrolase [Devosia enhydra]SFZ80716.1 uncharacterized protein SAMN02983003_0084 [Devosia enhydra]